jgi:organic radical activating enzyme
MSTNKTYCKAPWTALFVHPSGGVKCCCSGSYQWGDLQTNTIEDIVSSPVVNKLRQDIIDNVPNEYCKSCVNGEALSGTSQRSYFDKFTISDDKLKDPNLFELYSLDIRWNNLCNLSCVYCTDEWSTGWQKVKSIPISPAKLPYHENILNFIKSNSKTVESIIVAGGEPLLHKQNIQLLENLDESVDIGFITNLSINLESSPVFQLLKNRKNVTWSISLEGLGKRFEYVRRNASWDKMQQNIEFLHKHITTDQTLFFFPVYCLYSITEMVEYYKYAAQFDAKIHWQQLLGPDQLNVFNFSRPLRELAYTHIEDLLNNPVSSNLSYDDGFLNHARSQLLTIDKDQTYDIDFRNFTAEYEKDSNLKFSELWPELDLVIAK